MTKVHEIEKIAEFVQSHFSDRAKIVDYWESDLCAIGIEKEEYILYISCFNLLAKENYNNYDIVLEYRETDIMNECISKTTIFEYIKEFINK